MTSISQPAATPPGTPALPSPEGHDSGHGGHGHGDGGHGHGAHADHTITGFVIFLASESLIFLALFVGYAVFKAVRPCGCRPGSRGWRCASP